MGDPRTHSPATVPIIAVTSVGQRAETLAQTLPPNPSPSVATSFDARQQPSCAAQSCLMVVSCPEDAGLILNTFRRRRRFEVDTHHQSQPCGRRGSDRICVM